ncbi:MAG: hypothetical protein L0219_12980, partial [Phycisphaerales bacterium]|nr:hypothetical protein [Phycisphaerales bacterium]
MARDNCSKKLVALALGGMIAVTQGALAGVSASWNETSPNIFEFGYAATGMPDFDQYRSALPICGAGWDGPAAAMNVRAYAANHGFPSMDVPGPGNWQSNANYDYATEAMIQLCGVMGVSIDPPGYGTHRKDWFDALTASEGFDDPQFTRTAHFLSCAYQPRMYEVMQSLMMNPGLVSMLLDYYSPTPSGYISDYPAYCTISGGNGHWHKGTAEYSFEMYARVPWRPTPCPDSQSVFA